MFRRKKKTNRPVTHLIVKFDGHSHVVSEKKRFSFRKILNPFWWLKVVVYLVVIVVLSVLFFLAYLFVNPLTAHKRTFWLISFAIRADKDQLNRFFQLSRQAQAVALKNFRDGRK
jgi:hypothetical protein